MGYSLCEQCGAACGTDTETPAHADEMTYYATWCGDCWELGRWAANLAVEPFDNAREEQAPRLAAGIVAFKERQVRSGQRRALDARRAFPEGA
jgi:hypothetical protein